MVKSQIVLSFMVPLLFSLLITSAYAATTLFSSGMTLGPRWDYDVNGGWEDMVWPCCPVPLGAPRLASVTSSGTTFYSGARDTGRVWISRGGTTDRGTYPSAPWDINDVGDYIQATLSTNKGYTQSAQEFAFFAHDQKPASGSDNEWGFIFNGLTDNYKFRVYVQRLGTATYLDISSSALSNPHTYKAVRVYNYGWMISFYQDGSYKAIIALSGYGNSWVTVGFNNSLPPTGPDPYWTMKVTDVRVYG